MAQFESGVKYVPYSQEQVFNKLSDLSNLESVRDKLADKVQGMEFDSDSLRFTFYNTQSNAYALYRKT